MHHTHTTPFELEYFPKPNYTMRNIEWGRSLPFCLIYLIISFCHSFHFPFLLFLSQSLVWVCTICFVRITHRWFCLFTSHTSISREFGYFMRVLSFWCEYFHSIVQQYRALISHSGASSRCNKWYRKIFSFLFWPMKIPKPNEFQWMSWISGWIVQVEQWYHTHTHFKGEKLGKKYSNKRRK